LAIGDSNTLFKNKTTSSEAEPRAAQFLHFGRMTADKFDLQQYITRCYGSLTTFNIIFKNKDDQFRTSAVDRPNG